MVVLDFTAQRRVKISKIFNTETQRHGEHREFGKRLD